MPRCAIPLIQQQPHAVHTITSDNGTEFHGYAALEAAAQAAFYFATPHHAWERGSNENTNGLVRQYAPKRQSMGTSRSRTATRSPAGSTTARASGSATARRRNARPVEQRRKTRYGGERCTS
jgi:hypothetical protein